jgi:acetyl-CoA C-acetyltransferase
MREAVIISTARTPIGKAYRGAFNNTEAPTLGGHAVKHAVERAGLDPAEVEDVMMGCAMPQGSQGQNIGRQIALAAGLPVTTAGMTVDRQCSSGMMAIALAAKTVICDNVDIMVGHGAAPAHLDADDRHSRSGRETLRHQPRSTRRIRIAEPATHGCRPESRRLRR